MDPPSHIHVFENGMKLVMVPRSMSELVYVSIVMRNGCLDETKHTLAYTHFGEHLLAQLTSKRFPNADAITQRLGALGIEHNAFTRIFDTGYWLLGHRKHLSYMIQLLSSAYFRYQFAGDWEKQRNILSEEVKSYIDQWTPLSEAISKTLYPNHFLSTTLPDALHSIKHAKEHDVLQYLHKKLDPRVTSVLIEGDFDKDAMLVELTQAFDREKQQTYEQIINPSQPIQGPRLIRCKITASAVSKIVYTIQLPKMSRFNSQLHVQMEMMQQYFCSGYTSRLYYLLRETHGLIYSLESSYDLSPVPNEIPGDFIITIQVDPQQVDAVLKIVNEEIIRLQQHGVSRKQMMRIKNTMQFKNSMETLNVRPGKFVDNCAYYINWNEPVLTYTEYFEKLQAVTAKQIQRLSKRVFRPESTLIAIGDGK